MDKYLNTIIVDYKIIEKIKTGTYKAQCIHCGLIREYSIQTLRLGMKREGNSCKCTCTLSGIKKGDKFGRLTVLERALENQPYGRLTWRCRCDCGNIIEVIGKSLKDGNTKSCGCLMLEKSTNTINKVNSDLEDLTGQRFTKLTVLRQATTEETFNRPKGMRYWLCICDCGVQHIANTSDLKAGKVKSCGCLLSKGEEIISNILKENGIKFTKQFYFNDCVGQDNKKYRFDFGILNDMNNLQYLIEYDGIQHFSQRNQFGNDPEKSFKIIQERDNAKNNYCFSHNIPLIRIPYTLNEITIDELKLETTHYLVIKGE